MSCYSIRLSDDLKAADEGLLREAGHLDYFRVFGAAASGPTCLASLGFDFQLLNHLQGCKVRGDRWLLGASTAGERLMRHFI